MSDSGAIFSLRVLDKEGYVVKLKKGVMKVSMGSRIVMIGERSKGLYNLLGSIIVGYVASVSESKESLAKFWHIRLELV